MIRHVNKDYVMFVVMLCYHVLLIIMSTHCTVILPGDCMFNRGLIQFGIS